MKNGLEYYMKLPYVIELKPIPTDQGGGVIASIPQLGRYALCADGETVEEALLNLEEIKKERFSDYLNSGIIIPGPDREEEEYSGKFVVRLPKYLHRELALTAKLNDVSLNQFIVSVLASGVENLRPSAKFEGLEAELLKHRTSLADTDRKPVYDTRKLKVCEAKTDETQEFAA